jgi:Putative peptidoglycan binding domain
MRFSLLALAFAALLGIGAPSAEAANPLQGRGMWIWEVPYSSGGNVDAITSAARQYGISTVYVKSSDGTSMWSQFNPSFVQALHAAGVHVCAWQYVYGDHPVAEAQLGAEAVHDGADCLMIDAEVEYQGKYAQAQTYMSTLRNLVGYSYPLALAGFPYVDYHPSFPYSVFLGRGGAQYNAPQMYWRDIGVSVDTVFAHTYLFNRPYARPIYPLGEVYDNPPPAEIKRFRAVSKAYGAEGVSWWDWQEAPLRAWRALSQPVGTIPSYAPVAGMANLGIGAQGDLVVWAQEHLRSAGYKNLAIDGSFGSKTRWTVSNFQLEEKLPVTGIIDSTTWSVLLRWPPAYVRWAKPTIRVSADIARAGLTPPPKSATLPMVRDEIAGAGGRGHTH